MLIEFLSIVAAHSDQARVNGVYPDDLTGDGTITILRRTLDVARRITGNLPASLGLHPAVYFYNERGKHSRFLFLGLVALIAEKIRNNDSGFFRKFAKARAQLEAFVLENKSLFGILLQNMAKGQRTTKMKELFEYLVVRYNAGEPVTPQSVIGHLGARGRVYDIVATQNTPQISDDVKTMVFMQHALQSALKCPLCDGFLDPAKSVSYDHVERVRDGGTGDATNVRLAHPYCNSIRDLLEDAPQAASAG
ncbi:MAG: HNH endonuclease [Pyrinomonadaceae bacterium]|nr:HNH endonuclease [Pyrinomonadaceae bacterium]